MVGIRRTALAAITAGLVCVSAALGGAASAAPAGGVKGDPQPELKPFKIAASTYAGGNVAIEPNGALVVAGPEWFAVDQDPSGKTFVFSERAFSPVSYDLYEVSTWTGATWTGAVNLGNAVMDNTFGVGLDANGSGLVIGTAPAWGFPVLAAQGVSLSLKASTIRKGNATTASGKVGPVAKGRAVSLQVLRSGLWYTVATTHENAAGAFAFTIKGTAAGTYHYRAVASDLAGYVMYGYSAPRTLKVG